MLAVIYVSSDVTFSFLQPCSHACQIKNVVGSIAVNVVQTVYLGLNEFTQDIYTNSPRLSGSLPYTDQISRPPVQVTKSPG